VHFTSRFRLRRHRGSVFAAVSKCAAPDLLVPAGAESLLARVATCAKEISNDAGISW
jgi:hypothetical protein